MMLGGLAASPRALFSRMVALQGRKRRGHRAWRFRGLVPSGCPRCSDSLIVLVFLFWRFVSPGIDLSRSPRCPCLSIFSGRRIMRRRWWSASARCFAAALIICKHDANLQRLVEGTEPRFALRKSKGDST